MLSVIYANLFINNKIWTSVLKNMLLFLSNFKTITRDTLTLTEVFTSKRKKGYLNKTYV